MGRSIEHGIGAGLFGSRQSRSFAFVITSLTTLFTLTVFFYLSVTPSSAFEDDLSFDTDDDGLYSTSGPMDRLWKLKAADVQWKEWLGIHGVNEDSQERKVEAHGIRELKNLFDQRYPATASKAALSLNGPALDRLADCIESDTCGAGEGTVVILASPHFNNALDGKTSGEDIWARSTIEALISLNYTLLYTFAPMDTLTLYQGLADRVQLVMWEGSELKSCLARNETNWRALEEKHTHIPGLWQEEEQKFGCIKREGYEDGISLSKSFTFHFWQGPENPLGCGFTLAPENYALWNKGVGNRFLGYSVETHCRSIPVPLERQHRGMVLGKRPVYFNVTSRDWPWGSNHTLDTLILDMPSEQHLTAEREAYQEPFEMIATGGQMKDGQPESLYDGPIRNLGTMKQDAWYQTLAAGKFLLGVGKPQLSPSPYDALCLGVPFINPITGWNSSNPTDSTVWQTQHNGLRDIPEPYVYNVQRGNMEELERAMRKAAETPIERYIPPVMSTEAVRERHRVLVETDWTAEAERAAEEIYINKGREFPWLL